MGLESLLEIAFARGCGISRSEALTTNRYRELCNSAPHVPYVKPAEVAEMMYLGELLSDSAFKTMPENLQMHAANWRQYTIEEQHGALDDIMQNLSGKSWRELHGYGRNNKADVLPYVRGTWADSRLRPNCLGVAQMLMGFARKAEAPHLMLDVLEQRLIYLNRMRIIVIGDMLTQLKPFSHEPIIRTLIVKLERFRRRLVRVQALDERVAHQAHHALSLKVGDQWWGVDPYMTLKFRHHQSTEKLDGVLDELHEQPHRQSLLNGVLIERLSWDYLYKCFEIALDAYRRKDEDLDSLQLNQVCWEVSINAAHNESVMSDLSTEEFEEVVKDKSQMMCIAALVPRKRWHDDSYPFNQALFDKFDSSKPLRNLAVRRLLRFTVAMMLDSWNKAIEEKSALHSRMQLAHPGYHLAVMTLAHIGYTHNLSTLELIRFDRSQNVTRDTMKEVTEEGRPLLKRILEQRLRRLEGLESRFVMPALLAHQQERQFSHEQ